MTRPAELYACFYAREFPAQALLRLRPEVQGSPCVVMQGEPPLQTVCSLNTKARLLGITHGMTRVEVDTFQDTVVLTRSRETESATKAALLECAGSFSPRVEDHCEDAAFLCGIDIAGTQSLFGSPEMLARSLLQRVKAAGIMARITVSHNFYAAVSLAKGLAQSTCIKLIPQDKEAETLAALPVAVLPISVSQAEIFSLWGIHTLGMLAALPQNELISRMGQDGMRLRQLARGEYPHLFQPIELPFSLEEKMELDAPVELLESLLFVVGVMLDHLIVRATARILALANVTISLALEGGASYIRTVRPALPSADKQLWIKLLHLDLDAHPPLAAILAITLHAEPGSTSKVQLGLFSPQLPEAARLDVTLARIRAIVGEDCVGRAVLQDTHALDGFSIEPFTVPSKESTVTISTATRMSMRKLRPPEVVSITLRDSRPAMFLHRGRRFAVDRAYGPWLIDGDWWNPTLWGLEQWDLVARAQDGAWICCCMTRNVVRNQWQMAALYD